MTSLQKNQVYPCRITGYTADGSGVCHIDGRAVFVRGVIVGEEWDVKILKVTASAAYGKAVTLLSPVPCRVTPACPVYGKCGGCATLHMEYAEELRMKLDKVNQALHRIGGCDYTVPEILPSDRQDRYRNKSIVSVGTGADGRPVAGFYRQRSHDIIPAEDCLLQSELSNRVNRAVLDWMEAKGIPAYDEQTGKGAVRHIFTRTNRAGQAQVTVVSAKGFGSDTASLVSFLRERCPEVCGILLNINRTRGNSVLAGEFYLLWGEGTITETLCGFPFSIAPQAFFQINPPQAEKLYDRAVEYAAPDGGTVLDLYCGTGTITLCLSRKADRVIGAEIVPEAVENARENARVNGVGNAEFLCGDAGQAAAALRDRGIRPDCVVVDPPRKGMSPDTIQAITDMAPERIVYVSCDPATLARDAALLRASGYRITAGTAVDMFPHTHHVESVVKFTRMQPGEEESMETGGVEV